MDNARASFLASSDWADATPSPVAGDLSVRQYTRLSKPNASAIFMACDPARDTSLPAFLKMTDWLRAQDLSAPKVYAADVQAGFALLEDFGDNKLTTLIAQNPHSQRAYYEAILDTLIAIRNAPPPVLPKPTAQDLCEATRLADDWYPGAQPALLDAFRAGLEPVLHDLLKAPLTVSLRDFHADNIIWLPTRSHLKQPGLLDYQDAFLVHPAYDLMSLLTDARIDVPSTLQTEVIEAYAQKTGDDLSDLSSAVAAFGAQRNLRILGIFARAARRDGKAQHLTALPRVYRYLSDCCKHPALAPFARNLATALPEPTAKLIESIAS
ncbi:MAG: phosphotransferase [Boseongicola sp.]|nr:phosphotransferase [Boseongicola sp.]NNJ66989.1 phosphotransferase [Boseongicola sp.]